MEDFHPKVVHISAEKNTAADCLSRNEMKSMAFDMIDWERLKQQLCYCDFDNKNNEDSIRGKDIAMVMTQVMSHCNFEPDEFDDFLYPIATRAKVEAELKFPLSMHQMATDQMEDDTFSATVNRVQQSGSKRFT